MVGTQSEVVGDATELLHLVSEDAVESNTCLEKADIASSEADLIANLAGQLVECRVIGTDSQLLVCNLELRSDLAIGASKHLFSFL